MILEFAELGIEEMLPTVVESLTGIIRSHPPSHCQCIYNTYGI